MTDKKEQYQKLLYFYFQDYIFNLPAYERRSFTERTYLGKFKSIIKTFLFVAKQHLKSRKSLNKELSKNKNWVFIFDRNNYESTQFLSADKEVLFVSERSRVFSGSENVLILPLRRRLRHFLTFPVVVFSLYRKNGWRTFQIIDLVFSSIGWIETFDEVVKLYCPKSITFSNDHSFVPRALLIASKLNLVHSIYIQHAAVTESFPPLEFDLSLLEGKDALDKYSKSGNITGIVKIVGVPRFDRFVKLRRSIPKKDILNFGIAFNTVDSIVRVVETITLLSKKYPNRNFYLRKHPKDVRDFETPFHGLVNIKFSNPYEESSFLFILKCDVLIAGDSSIHLDARLLNVDSFYFDFSQGSKIVDLYGFRKNGLVKELRSIDSICDLIDFGLNGEDVFFRAKYYNELIGSAQESNASHIAFDEFSRFLQNVS